MIASSESRRIAWEKAFSASRLPTLWGYFAQKVSKSVGEEPPLGGEGGNDVRGLGDRGVGKEPSGGRRSRLSHSVTRDSALRAL